MLEPSSAPRGLQDWAKQAGLAVEPAEVVLGGPLSLWAGGSGADSKGAGDELQASSRLGQCLHRGPLPPQCPPNHVPLLAAALKRIAGVFLAVLVPRAK